MARRSSTAAAVSADGAGRIYKALRSTLTGHAGSVLTVACAPDGKTIASGSEDGTVKLWDPATGRERCTLVGHTGGLVAVAISPDGSLLASASADMTVRLWGVM